MKYIYNILLSGYEYSQLIYCSLNYDLTVKLYNLFVDRYKKVYDQVVATGVKGYFEVALIVSDTLKKNDLYVCGMNGIKITKVKMDVVSLKNSHIELDLGYYDFKFEELSISSRTLEKE